MISCENPRFLAEIADGSENEASGDYIMPQRQEVLLPKALKYVNAQSRQFEHTFSEF
ncbi:MAG: hypothetical protein K2J79_09030 [Ruminiclostridium sp.]|nr:hypothetical protein [Ruminiclostridium sp.]